MNQAINTIVSALRAADKRMFVGRGCVLTDVLEEAPIAGAVAVQDPDTKVTYGWVAAPWGCPQFFVNFGAGRAARQLAMEAVKIYNKEVADKLK